MGYESHICGSIEIDKDKWETFCYENKRVEEVSGNPTEFVFDMMPEEWEWDEDELVISTIWCKHYDFEKFLDEVVKMLNDDQTGCFDWHGEDYARSSFYLKKNHWEELEWQAPKAPKWYWEIKKKRNVGLQE